MRTLPVCQVEPNRVSSPKTSDHTRGGGCRRTVASVATVPVSSRSNVRDADHDPLGSGGRLRISVRIAIPSFSSSPCLTSFRRPILTISKSLTIGLSTHVFLIQQLESIYWPPATELPHRIFHRPGRVLSIPRAELAALLMKVWRNTTAGSFDLALKCRFRVSDGP